MNSFRRLILQALAVFFLAGFWYSFYWIWKNVINQTPQSCVSSIARDVVEYVPSSPINSVPQDENWHILSDDQANIALSRVSFVNCERIDNVPQDISERNLQIAVKRYDKHGFKIMVWSKGFDNISGTEDDVVDPKGENIPN